MKDNLKIPDIMENEDYNTVRELFCNLAVGRTADGNEHEKYCKGIQCNDCMFSEQREQEFVAWFGTERIKGNLSII